MSVLTEASIIDFHSYLGNDAYSDFTQSASGLLRKMDEFHISQAVVAPLVDFPGTQPRCHGKLLLDIQAHQDRFIPFARLDPRYGITAVEALRRLVLNKGFEGLLFDPSSCRTLPYHPGALRLLDCAEELRLPVLIPTGDAYYSLPEHIGILAEKRPSLHLILGHMGTAFHAQRCIDIAASHDNIFLETSLQQSPARIAFAVEAIGPERLLFGSGSPYGELKSELIKISQAQLPHGTHTAILGANACSLLQSLRKGRRTL